jgi:hypothetical protein
MENMVKSLLIPDIFSLRTEMCEFPEKSDLFSSSCQCKRGLQRAGLSFLPLNRYKGKDIPVTVRGGP